MKRHWIVVGGGGHAVVVADCLEKIGHSIYGYTSLGDNNEGVLGLTRLGGDEFIMTMDPSEVALANGIGSVRNTEIRTQVYINMRMYGYLFPSFRHPSAVVAKSTEVGAGSQIMAGVVVQPRCRIGENVLVNTRVSIDHDCIIHDHVHVAPGVTISGGVTLGRGAHIGTGAVVIEGVRIGNNATVGAGSVVVRDVADDIVVKGIPAR